MNVYQVLKRPILTEKTDFQRDDNQYVFEVDRSAGGQVERLGQEQAGRQDRGGDCRPC